MRGARDGLAAQPTRSANREPTTGAARTAGVEHVEQVGKMRAPLLEVPGDFARPGT